jgi:hypothetical protein
LTARARAPARLRRRCASVAMHPCFRGHRPASPQCDARPRAQSRYVAAMLLRRRAIAGILLGLAINALGACDSKPKQGGKCDLADQDKLLACADETSALRCSNLRLTKTPCRGPAGCSSAAAATCDRSLAAVGDPCEDRSATEVCSVDRKRALVCSDGVFVEARPCAGPKGCDPASGVVACDQSIGEVGQPCTGRAASALAARIGSRSWSARARGRGRNGST